MSDTFDAYRPTDATAPADPLPFDVAFSAVQRSISIGGRTVLRPYLLLAGAVLVVTLLGQTPPILSGLAVDFQIEWLALVVNILQWIVSLLVMATSFLVGGLTLGLYRPLRLALLEGPDAVAEKGGALALARQRYGWALLSIFLFGIILTTGLLFCVLPGFAVLAFLGMMPFLVVACDEDLGSGFQRSVNLLLRNPLPLLGGYGAVFVIQLLVIGLTFAIGAGVGLVAGLVGAGLGFPVTAIGIGGALGSLIGGVIGLPIGYLNMLIIGGTFVSVEAHDSGHELMLDDEILV